MAAAVRAAAHRSAGPQPHPMTVGELATARGLSTAFPGSRPVVDLSKRRPPSRPSPVAALRDDPGKPPADLPSTDAVGAGDPPTAGATAARSAVAEAEAVRPGRERPEPAAEATPTHRPARPEGPPQGLRSPVEPRNGMPAGPAPFQRPAGPLPPPPRRPPNRFSVPARPPVVDESAILGLTRRSRGRVGSRVFLLFFVFVYAVIVLQLIAVLLGPSS
jgi:hypothetical protein